MTLLKEAADIEQKLFESEWAQLGQMIEKDRKSKGAN